MATPTITRILAAGAPVGSQARGPSAGRSLVEIYGSNFRVPTSEPGDTISNGVVTGDEPKTVSVTFGGVEAESVKVIRSNLLRVVTPINPFDDDVSVDVVVTNLDDSEVAIPSESVTSAAAYSYLRPKLDATNQPDLVRLIRTLIATIQKQVLRNVLISQDTDHDTDIATAIVDIADVPAIVLLGPRFPENRFYSKNDDSEVSVSGGFELHRKTRTNDVVFDIVGISNSTIESLSLMNLLNVFVERNNFISMPLDPTDLAKGNVSYEFDFESRGDGFAMTSRSNSSNIKSFTGTVIIRGFESSYFEGFDSDSLRDVGVQLEDVPSISSVAFTEN